MIHGDQPSCPDLILASTETRKAAPWSVDGRVEPGHDGHGNLLFPAER
jgi:hypothetical protein